MLETVGFVLIVVAMIAAFTICFICINSQARVYESRRDKLKVAGHISEIISRAYTACSFPGDVENYASRCVELYKKELASMGLSHLLRNKSDD